MPAVGAAIQVVDNDNNIVASATVAADGQVANLSVPVQTITEAAGSSTVLTTNRNPITLRASWHGLVATRVMTLSQNQTVTIDFPVAPTGGGTSASAPVAGSGGSSRSCGFGGASAMCLVAGWMLTRRRLPRPPVAGG
jgi:hypothetical protein